ncbi:MAG: AEC family transporter, partial [Rhodospirillaceae bacterium]
MFQEIFSIIAPVFLIALVGYVWRARRMPFDTAMITDLVTYIGAPCLVFSSLVVNGPEVSAIGEIVAASLLVALGALTLGAGVLKVFRLPLQAYLPALFVPNSGNMGLPLCLLAFGERGLSLAVAYYAATTVIQFTAGVSIASGKLSS